MAALRIANLPVRWVITGMTVLGFPLLSNPGYGQTPPPSQPPNVEFVTPTPPPGGSSIYTIEGGKRLMDEAASAVSGQNYTVAAQKLLQARTVMNQLSNYYQSLSSSFLGIDGSASDSSRRRALESAQIRDQATYQLALVYRANNQPELAIPLLVEIIRSQNPTRDLGQKSYQQLLELGFVDIPFPRGGTVPMDTSTPSAPPPVPPQS
ncbi:hypothetical protein L3556_13215 [Candidatus Synechococcus calcipolaris G9]|uniref:Uncharacterized protein n=1 Tax=Candidatus Synechococcus calcipolaris G9 TaxID=1497997 RepID=A0ABT6F231_9SYNE|nr:hypothetical protein [Candidatus Synechococcus calcipolaris]MDG2991882.1 hypothetical protein [Candidatus Synechococcus calcipolaris G9]